MLFWLLCAIDGHAKNFSISHESGGAFHLTPRYDVLSMYPHLGSRRGQLPAQKVKMAMAVRGRSRHYRWREIRADHFLEVGRTAGLADSGAPILESLLAQVPAAIEAVTRTLPAQFPESVSAPIFAGLATACRNAREQL